MRSASHSEVVVGDPVLAALLVDRRRALRQVRQPALELVGRGVHGDARLVAAGGAREALLDVGGGVLGRQRARREAHAGRRGPLEPVDAERPPVLAAAVPGDQVPAAAAVDERVRLDLAAAGGAVAAAVGEAQALAVAAGGGDRGQRAAGRRSGRPAAARRSPTRARRRAGAGAPGSTCSSLTSARTRSPRSRSPTPGRRCAARPRSRSPRPRRAAAAASRVPARSR